MNPAIAQTQPPVDINPIVSNDTLALASHMSDCQRSHGPFFPLLAALDWVQALAAGHIVTTGALVATVGLGLLLVLP